MPEYGARKKLSQKYMDNVAVENTQGLINRDLLLPWKPVKIVKEEVGE